MVEVTFREYLKASKDATVNGLKITGAIFTVIMVIILLLTEWGNLNSIAVVVKWLAICILLGYALGLFIMFLAVVSEYTRFKSTIRFFNSISESIKKHYGLYMGDARTSKYDFPKPEIVNHIPNSPIVQFRIVGNEAVRHRDREKKGIGIILYALLGENADFHRKKFDFDRKYKKQDISLTKWGLKKTVSIKEWNTMREKDINVYLRELHEIADNEEMNIVKWSEAQEVNNL